MQRLLRPRSIALLGGSACAEVIRQCRRIGFQGLLWPIHPSLPEMEGLRVYRSVEELPDGPDAAFVAVNRHATIEAVRALVAAGAGGAVCYASGFAEVGPSGVALQEQLEEAAGDLPFIGPNCHGLLNYLDGVALWPEQHGGVRQARGVALITQSGNIALNLTMQRRALPIAYVITLGNQARIGLADAIEALLDDTRISAIGLHIEGIGDPSDFMRAATLARARGVPLVALKSGRSDLGARLAFGHTASLGGTDAVADAFLARAGVARVHSLPILVETLKLLHVHGPLPGREIASMSCSGGEASLIADASTGLQVHFRPLTEPQAQLVAGTLPELAAATNPLDYHNFTWGNEAALASTYAAMMQASFDLTLLILDFPRADRCSQGGFDTTLRAFTAASRTTGARAAVVSTLQDTFPEARAQQMMDVGIAPLFGLDDALAAIAAAARLGGEWQPPGAVASVSRTVSGGTPHSLSEWDSKRALAGYGLVIPRAEKVTTPQAAVAAARAIGFPVAVKSVGASILHKTEIGGVQLDLKDEAAVHAAATRQLAAHGAELLIEEMVRDPVAELIVGVDRDAALGLYLVVGSGGVLVELVRDRRILMLPTTRSEILEAIHELKAGALIRGHRGRPPGDLEAAADAVQAIQAFVMSEPSRLLELDVNPLIVRPRGHGAVAVDALIRLTGSTND